VENQRSAKISYIGSPPIFATYFAQKIGLEFV